MQHAAMHPGEAGHCNLPSNLCQCLHLQVERANIRPAPEKQTVYMGVSAPKRKRVEEEPIVTEMPKVIVFYDLV